MHVLELASVLSNCSLAYRQNSWELFIRPLFEFVLPLFHYESSVSRKDELDRLLKRTFKNFTKLSRTTPDALIHALCGYDLKRSSEEIIQEQTKKWTTRVSHWTEKYEGELLT